MRKMSLNPMTSCNLFGTRPYIVTFHGFSCCPCQYFSWPKQTTLKSRVINLVLIYKAGAQTMAWVIKMLFNHFLKHLAKKWVQSQLQTCFSKTFSLSDPCPPAYGSDSNFDHFMAGWCTISALCCRFLWPLLSVMPSPTMSQFTDIISHTHSQVLLYFRLYRQLLYSWSFGHSLTDGGPFLVSPTAYKKYLINFFWVTKLI